MATKKKEESKKITLFITIKHVKLDNGTEFDAFKTPIGKLNIDVKFTKAAEKSKPDENGYYEFNAEDVNIDTRKDYPVIWIQK